MNGIVRLEVLSCLIVGMRHLAAVECLEYFGRHHGVHGKSNEKDCWTTTPAFWPTQCQLRIRLLFFDTFSAHLIAQMLEQQRLAEITCRGSREANRDEMEIKVAVERYPTEDIHIEESKVFDEISEFLRNGTSYTPKNSVAICPNENITFPLA